MTKGIHHVTGITANVQANVDFYAGFLGLKLVKRTGGYEDAEQLHLFYGDESGSPGSLLSFLVWEAAGRGRVGLGQVSEVSLAVGAETIGDWLTKALSERIAVEGPSREFGEPVLRLKDPDGLIVKLVGVGEGEIEGSPLPSGIIRIRGVTLLCEAAEESARFLRHFGYAEAAREGAMIRLRSETDIVDIRAAAGFVPSIPGAGILDHVAFRAEDVAAVQSLRIAVKDHGPTHVHDRKYFLSLYLREPSQLLFEYATDAPGMTVDEAPDHLGETLFLPPDTADRAEDLRVMLPQFALPGEERFPMRDLPFIHRFHRPETEDGSTIILLHGTGGNEADLMPLAHKINPRATLLGVRGRSTEEGINRWFRRYNAMSYDQDDIRSEAEAFAAFTAEAIRGYGIDAAKLTFLGYSNGANLLASLLQLHPGVIRRAILLRSVQVLEEVPDTEASGESDVLLITGAHDPFALNAPKLEAALRAAGVTLSAQVIEAGHELTPEDLSLAEAWLTAEQAG